MTPPTSTIPTRQGQKVSFALVIGLVGSFLVTTTHAFRPHALRSYHPQRLARATMPMPSTTRLYSDMPRSNPNENEFFTPPPPIEDLFVLTGDCMSLAIYSMTDHWICRDLSDLYLRQTVTTVAQVQATAASTQIPLAVPVWLEPAQDAFSLTWGKTQLADVMVTAYSPLLQSTGFAAMLLCSTWLAAGWWHASFSYHNTLQCPTDRALLKTFQTWVTSSTLLLGLVALQHAVCGCDVFTSGATGNLFTRGDLAYILDSLTVLVLWRFLVSRLLGGMPPR